MQAGPRSTIGRIASPSRILTPCGLPVTPICRFPVELGGGGASLLDICMAQERLARGDGATALAVNMHLGFLWILGDLWRSSGESGHDFLEKVAQDRSILFGAVSDPAADSSQMRDRFRLHDGAG